MNRKEMIKELEEVIQIVLLRIPKEIEAMIQYQNAATKAKGERAKELFTSLALQEKGHEAELKRILVELKVELEELKKS